jgi:ABC-type uncharacterized transport system YnjBCD substrate-binding protein
MNKKLPVIAGLLMAVFLAACNFTTTTTTSNAFDKVKVGMTPEQVIEAMGESNSITKIELWKYQEGDTTIDISIQDGQVVNVRTMTVKSLNNGKESKE